MASADDLWAEGITEYLQAAKANPENVENCVAGLRKFEASIDKDASDSKRHFFVATLRYRSGKLVKAEESYELAIATNPCCGHAYLELVLFLENHGRRDDARKVAARAIKAGARWADEWQRCPIFVTGVTSKPWWKPETFTWISELEAAYPVIKNEMFELLAAKGGKPSVEQMPHDWVKVGDERATHDGTIVAPGGEWREFVIYSAQEETSGDVRKHLPQTCTLLEEVLPGAVAMAKIGVGEIIFSALAPGSKLLPHCASSNVRLTCHLGLVCPEGAKVRVGAEWGTWEEGKCIFFDDSFEHEVVNDGNGVRIVLLIRFWHPELLPDQWLPTLNAGMDEYNSMYVRRSSPPANAAVSQLLSARGQIQTGGYSQKPPELTGAESAAAVLKADAPDLALRPSETSGLALTEVEDDLF